jgi:hypothetical protein
VLYEDFMDLSLILAVICGIILNIYLIYISIRFNNLKKKIIKDLIRDFKIRNHHQTFNVYFNTERNFKKLNKATSSGFGILIMNRKELTFIGKKIHLENTSIYGGKGLIIHFDRNFISTEWHGLSLRNGFMHWLKISMDDESYYFSTDTGFFRFGTKMKTCNTYKSIKNRYR